MQMPRDWPGVTLGSLGGCEQGMPQHYIFWCQNPGPCYPLGAPVTIERARLPPVQELGVAWVAGWPLCVVQSS